MQHRRAPVVGQLGPDAAGLGFSQGRVTVENRAVDQLALHAPAPGPEVGLEAVALGVDAQRHDHMTPGDLAQRDVFGPLAQRVLVGAVALLFKGLRQPRVDENAQQADIAAARGDHGRIPLFDQRAPAQPTQRAVQAAELKAAHAPGHGARRIGHPGAGGQHGGLVVLADLGAAGAADIAHGVGQRPPVGVALPLDAVRLVGAPFQRLQIGAVRARDVEAAAVAGQVARFDAAEVLGGGRAGQQALAAGEGGLAGFGQLDRVALAVDVHRVAVDLVQEQVAHRHAAQARGAVGAGDGHEAAGELFEQRGVGVVAAAVFAHLAAQHRAFFDHRRQALAAVALGHVDRGLHDHHRARVAVDQVAQPVGANGRLAGLRAPHQHHLFGQAVLAQAVHRLGGVRRSLHAVGAGLGAVLA